jgi:hypothetical protein
MSISDKTFRSYGTSSDINDEENASLLPFSNANDIQVNSNKTGYKVLLFGLVLVATFIGAFLLADNASTTPSSDKQLSFGVDSFEEEVTRSQVVAYDTEKTMEGYTLFSFMLDKPSFLIDNKGYVMRRWEDDYIAGQNQVITPDGFLLKSINLENPKFPTAGLGGGIHKFDFEGNIVRELVYDGDTWSTHHDVKQMANGNIMVIAWDLIDVDHMIDLGMDPIEAIQFNDTGITAERIIEFNLESGDKVWEWSVLDHLVQNIDPSKANYKESVADNPHLIDINYVAYSQDGWVAGYDWLHANAVEYIPDHDVIVISIHNMNELWFIDKSTTTAEAATNTGGTYGKGGDLLYRFGNPAAHQFPGKTYENDRLMYLQHDPTDISNLPSHGGNILVFNNGQESVGRDFTSIDEIYIDFNTVLNSSDISTYDTNPDSIVWSYINTADMYFSSDTGSAMRLNNGNTFVNWGNRGFFSEFDTDKNEVWKWVYSNDDDDVNEGVPFFRAYKYPTNYTGFDGVTLKDTGIDLSINHGQGPLPILAETTSAAESQLTSMKGESVAMKRLLENRDSIDAQKTKMTLRA